MNLYVNEFIFKSYIEIFNLIFFDKNIKRYVTQHSHYNIEKMY